MVPWALAIRRLSSSLTWPKALNARACCSRASICADTCWHKGWSDAQQLHCNMSITHASTNATGPVQLCMVVKRRGVRQWDALHDETEIPRFHPPRQISTGPTSTLLGSAVSLLLRNSCSHLSRKKRLVGLPHTGPLSSASLERLAVTKFLSMTVMWMYLNPSFFWIMAVMMRRPSLRATRSRSGRAPSKSGLSVDSTSSMPGPRMTGVGGTGEGGGSTGTFRAGFLRILDAVAGLLCVEWDDFSLSSWQEHLFRGQFLLKCPAMS